MLNQTHIQCESKNRVFCLNLAKIKTEHGTRLTDETVHFSVAIIKVLALCLSYVDHLREVIEVHKYYIRHVYVTMLLSKIDFKQTWQFILMSFFHDVLVTISLLCFDTQRNSNYAKYFTVAPNLLRV